MSCSVSGCQSVCVCVSVCVWVCVLVPNWSFSLVKCPNVRAPHPYSLHHFTPKPPLCACVPPPSPPSILLLSIKTVHSAVRWNSPKPSSYHLDNHFLLFAFYLDLIIFHLQQDGNHKLHCVPYAFSGIKHAARIIDSANGEKCYKIFNMWTQHPEVFIITHTVVLYRGNNKHIFEFIGQFILFAYKSKH